MAGALMGVSVGIVTMVGNFNYGNRLQNYAVSKIYESLGCSVETLDYRGHSLPSAVRHLAADILLPREATHPEEMMSRERKDSFARFTSLIPTRRVDVPMSDLASQYDLFSVGSDQVWNPNYVDSYRWMFLRFADRRQRIALAPSIGLSSLQSPYARAMISRGLLGFDYLSVREESGAELIKELTGRDAQVVIDPTLMLTPETWRRVANGRMVPDGEYVLTYLLGDKSESQDKFVGELVSENRASLVRLSDKARKGEIDAGPAEFIALIDGASHVVTDSYHAAVFSILMSTPLTIFKREGRSNLFSRLATLTKKFDLGAAVFGEDCFCPDVTISPTRREEILREERERVADHLGLSSALLDTSSLVLGV